MQGFKLLSGSVVDPDAAVLPDPVSDRSETLKIIVADPDLGSGIRSLFHTWIQDG
jgi:hypothetical protein